MNIAKHIRFMSIVALIIPALVIAQAPETQNVAALVQPIKPNSTLVELSSFGPVVGTIGGALAAGCVFKLVVGSSHADPGTIFFTTIAVVGSALLGGAAGCDVAKAGLKLSEHNVAISNNQLESIKLLLALSQKSSQN